MRTGCIFMVIPRSRSSSMESKTCSRILRASIVWVISNIRSAKVLLPWSICAMIEKFLICFRSIKFLFQKAAGLMFPEFSIKTLLGQQFLMGALFHYLALVQHDYPIHFLNGGQTVCDNDSGFPFHQLDKSILNVGFADTIQRTGGFIQHQNRRILKHRPSDSHSLPFPAGKLDSALPHQRVVALGKFGNKFMGVSFLGHFGYFIGCGGYFSVSNILPNRAMKQNRLLWHIRDNTAQVILGNASYILPINSNGTLRHIVEPKQ